MSSLDVAALPRPWGTGTDPWREGDIKRWSEQKMPLRSYTVDVLSRLDNLTRSATCPISVERYGPESGNYRRVRIGSWTTAKPKILITGGVHGYELSGVAGALTFAERIDPSLVAKFDFLIYPCISPVSYQFNLRWNLSAQDPNRHFCRDPQRTESGRAAVECEAFMDSIDAESVEFLLAHDLHETTNSDLQFRQEKIFRDGKTDPLNTVIPQGFYLVLNKSDEGQPIGPRIITEVRGTTKIADEPVILGVENKNGIVYLDLEKYPGLCMNYSRALHRITTEVYPDIITPEEAVAAQLASICGALNYLSCRD